MPPLSIAIICKNSQRTIRPVLESVRPLIASGGEIVAVDSGSTDDTIAILDAAGARVIREQWHGFCGNKNIALDACTHDWVLHLDSDEPVMPDLCASILAALASPEADAYRVNRKIWYRGRPLNYAWQPEWRLRLHRRGNARWAGAEPHPSLVLLRSGTVRDLPGTLRHDSFETFIEHLTRQVSYSRIGAEALAREGVRGSRWRLFSSPIGAFLKQIVLKSAWRDGVPGWLAAATSAAGALMKHAALLELTRMQRPPDRT